ncbi:unnamed protein product [Echinostoma caproni]|uniref:EF-hand domain-containing protein n=1 Tax=Echinostoma caproni TaxID=27848 RepID=A0A183AR22_9TREM|nr:unnamed protein product [Echinostoma caproni]
MLSMIALGTMEPMRADGRQSICYDNLIIGVPRVRQLRMSSNSCLIPTDFREDIRECYGPYDVTHEDKTSFGPMNGTAWIYTPSDELEMSLFWGTASLYGGGGYYVDLSTNRSEADDQLQFLFDNLWLDRGTRAVFLHFTSYNPNLNLFSVAQIVVEAPGSGGLISTSEFRSVKLLRYVTTFDYFVLACECIFLLFTLYYIVEEIMEISKHKCSYFTSVWNWLDIIIIALSLICAAFNIYRTIKVNELLDDLLQNPDQFANFQLLSIWQVNFNYGIAVTTFLAWMKIFKYISFNKTMTQLSSTLGNCAKDLAGFAVIYTLFRIILGDFDFAALERANSVFGPIYFIVYVFFVFFVLLNMFIAIINETYVGVKSDLQNQTNDFEMKDFFKTRMKKMLDRLHRKKNRIEKLQQAMELANTNKGGRMDFLELREHLNSQGFTAEEIDNVFGRFDTDQDKTLSSVEQLKMQAKLEEEKMALVSEIAKEEQVALETGLADETIQVPPVTQREFTRALKRLGRIETGMSTMMQHLSTVLQGLSSVEKAKLIRREAMTELLQTVITCICSLKCMLDPSRFAALYVDVEYRTGFL